MALQENQLDLFTRKVISLLFRLLLIVYGVTILIRWKEDNFFSWYYYLVGSIVYLLIYSFLFNKEGILSRIRLLVDYVFINFIIYQKDIADFHISIFIILPILNALNHSSAKNKNSIFSLPLYIFTILTIVLNGKFEFSHGYITALVALGIISFFTYIRVGIANLNSSLSSVIEDFYIQNYQIGKTHKILRNLVEKQNKLAFKLKILFSIEPKSILCFKIIEDRLQILITSDFTLRYEFYAPNSFITTAKKQGYVAGYNITIDSINYTGRNFSLFARTPYNEYVFVVLYKGKFKPDFLTRFYANKILKPIFFRIAGVLDVEYELKLEREKYFKQIKAKMQYVESAVNAIHFLNNRLTPITSYFGMLKEYETLNVDEDIKSQVLKIIDEERKRAENNIEPIISKMHDIANKSRNPYIITEITEVSYKEIFYTIRTMWNEAGLDKNGTLVIYWTQETLDKTLSFNIDAFKFSIDEIFDNIKKHSNGFHTISFMYEGDHAKLVFENPIKNYDKEFNDYISLVNDFNVDNIGNLMKRSRHGMKMLKQFLQQLNVKFELKVDSVTKHLVLEIIFE